MAVVIRLKSVGTKKKIKHRVVVTDSRFPRDGRFLEEVGFWDPAKEPATLTIKNDRVEFWISKGAKPSETVKSILKKVGIMPKSQTSKPKKAKTGTKAKSAK